MPNLYELIGRAWHIFLCLRPCRLALLGCGRKRRRRRERRNLIWLKKKNAIIRLNRRSVWPPFWRPAFRISDELAVHHLKSRHLLGSKCFFEKKRKKEGGEKKGLHRIVCKLQSASATDMKMLEAGKLFPGRGLLCHLGGWIIVPFAYALSSAAGMRGPQGPPWQHGCCTSRVN